MKVKAFHPFTLIIDGEEIALRLKRQTMEENIEFMNGLRQVGEATAARFIFRDSSDAEQEKDENGNYKISFLELAEKKIPQLPPEKLEEYKKVRAEEEQQAQAYLRYVFSSFVRVEKGLIEELDDGSEKSVSDGIDVLRLYGAREDVIGKILEAVRLENMLPAAQKKTWRSPAVSSRTSTGRRRVRAGRKQGKTARRAETEASAGKEDAKQNLNGPSGSTGTS